MRRQSGPRSVQDGFAHRCARGVSHPFVKPEDIADCVEVNTGFVGNGVGVIVVGGVGVLMFRQVNMSWWTVNEGLYVYVPQLCEGAAARGKGVDLVGRYRPPCRRREILLRSPCPSELKC